MEKKNLKGPCKGKICFKGPNKIKKKEGMQKGKKNSR